MDSTIWASLITVAGTLLGVWIGSLISKKASREAVAATHKSALEIIQINEFKGAATKFRNAFYEELVVIKSRQRGDTPDAYEILEKAFQKHHIAVTEFRCFLREDIITAFNNAWDEYHLYDSEHYLKQYSDDVEGFHDKYPMLPHLMAIERIESLLIFAKPQ